MERQSKDEKVNRGGRKLINLIEEMSRSIFNGCNKGDEKGEFTFTAGRGNTVIDYIIGEKRMWDRIERIKVGEKVDSDHQLVEVWIKATTKKRENKKEKWDGRRIWNDEINNMFVQKLGELELGGGDIGEKCEMMEMKVKLTLREMKRELGMEQERKWGWWDRECIEEKKELRRRLRK